MYLICVFIRFISCLLRKVKYYYKENQIQQEESKSENFFLKMVSLIYFIVSEINILIKFR